MNKVSKVREYLARRAAADDEGARAALAEFDETLAGTATKSETDDVVSFNTKFGLPIGLTPRLLEMPDLKDRHNFLDEEVTEFYQSMHHGDLIGVTDALVDIVYVAKGTAVMMGLSWREHWDAVQKANMAKELVSQRDGYKRGVVKPPGWAPPDHASILWRGKR